MSNQFSLLKKKRFLPFFITQLLGAANDNIFKQALVLLLLFKIGVDNEGLWVNIAAGLFILPFFLFSSIAGQCAEKYEKNKIIITCKSAEVVSMAIATVGLYLSSAPILLLALFLMGSTSAFFGPAKYSLMPQHLKKEELLGGNALVEMGTFLAILVGTIVGGYFVMLPNGENIIVGIIMGLAIIGYLTSRLIPSATSSNPNRSLSFNIFKGTKDLYTKTKGQKKSVFNSVLAISWFWFIGAFFLAQIPVIATFIHADSVAVTLFLAIFSVGIGIGSLLCEKLSRRGIELGIVPLGSLGITVCTAFFALLIGSMHNQGVIVDNNSIKALWDAYGNEMTMMVFSLFGIGFFGGLYTVPLYAIIQTRTESDALPSVIAGNNMLNAAFMVSSALFGMALYAILGDNLSTYFYILAGMNAIVAIYIYKTVPEFFLRFCAWMISHTLYRVKYNNFDNIPDKGACIVASNHVSFMDALVVFGAVHRPVKFVMFEPIYKLPVLNRFFKAVGAIPIASKKDNPEVFEEAFNRISEYLSNGEVVCIFPEGKLTSNGEVDEFKQGIVHILKRNPVPVIPMAVNGLWGSMFSRKRKLKLPRLQWSRLTVSSDEPIQPEDFSLKGLEKIVKEMHKKGGLK